MEFRDELLGELMDGTSEWNFLDELLDRTSGWNF